ncbi:MAG: hypothetical protein ACLTJ8_00035 [Veillonella atypica]
MATSLKSYEKKYKALEDIVRQLDDGRIIGRAGNAKINIKKA